MVGPTLKKVLIKTYRKKSTFMMCSIITHVAESKMIKMRISLVKKSSIN